MPNVRIITDTISQLPSGLAKEYSIEVIPAATVVCDGKVLTDGVDLTLSAAFALLEQNPRQWVTAAITPSYFVTAFDELSELTNDILCITASSKLTTVYNSAILATAATSKKRPGLQLRVFDSMNASG